MQRLLTCAGAKKRQWRSPASVIDGNVHSNDIQLEVSHNSGNIHFLDHSRLLISKQGHDLFSFNRFPPTVTASIYSPLV
jgi:hypothetical protein